MIDRSLVETLYEPASIQRWNDHLRPAQGFTELDKQAQKMVYAYVLGKFEEESGVPVDWIRIIEFGLFELLHRITLTDIKPPIFHLLMAEKGPEINEWVLKRYEDERYLAGGLYDRFRTYLTDSGDPVEKRIIGASHYLATKWEFAIIYRMNAGQYGLEKEREAIEAELKQHSGLRGVQETAVSLPVQSFMDLVSQLRFQQRWSQTIRLPQTSVLGHSLIVAVLSYFASLAMGAGPRRAYNNYFCGLFHDLPEVLTRDIVAPVKRGVEGLDEIIKEIEKAAVESTLYPLLPSSWHQEIRYFVEDEFEDRAVINGIRQTVSDIGRYASDEFSPLDGQMVRACDELAAHAEAFLSVQHGVKSDHLLEAMSSIFSRYRDRVIGGVDFGRVFRTFDPTRLA